ncbi:hypothetical protein D7S89_04405 [Trinickia fusca]|uniref:Uncharacterized protein n=1 Tax=Trinickia fusca TaxID=2419777 RepID=A0A494XQ20_9BURK|nr:hypothetical protein D7S89_04405 [Trinickia fusca]
MSASCPRFSICSLLSCMLNPTTWVMPIGADVPFVRFKDSHDFELQFPVGQHRRSRTWPRHERRGRICGPGVR